MSKVCSRARTRFMCLSESQVGMFSADEASVTDSRGTPMIWLTISKIFCSMDAPFVSLRSVRGGEGNGRFDATEILGLRGNRSREVESKATVRPPVARPDLLETSRGEEVADLRVLARGVVFADDGRRSSCLGQSHGLTQERILDAPAQGAA